MRVETFVAGPLANNIYLLVDEAAGEAVVVDPSIDSGTARARVRQLQSRGVRLMAIWNTHGHFDHVYDNALWKSEFGAPLWMHRDDLFWVERLREQSLWMGLTAPQTALPDRWIEAGSVMRVGQYAARVLHTPGHSPGSVSFVCDSENVCVSGDVLFHGSVGRTDLPGCSPEKLRQSLRQLVALPAATRILPGHGEATTIEHEMATNPFCLDLSGDALDDASDGFAPVFDEADSQNAQENN